MRRRDKLKNIDRANLLAEQRYLKSKGLLTEGTESTNWDEVLTRNLTDPSSDLFTFDFNGKRTTLRVTRVNKISFDNIKFLYINVQLEPNRIIGDTQTIVVGNNAKDVFLPSKGNTGELELVGNSKSWLSAVRQNMLKQKSQQQDDTINESGMAHAAGFADGGSGFEEGAIGGVTEMESTRFPYKFYGKPLTLTDSNGQTWETSIKNLTAYPKSGGTNIRIGLNDKPNNIDIKPDGTIIINGLGASNQMQAKVEGESAAMIDTIRSIIAKQQDDTINEYGIKKNRKRIKITESQRSLLKSKGLLKEDYNAPFNTGEMKAFLGGLGFSDMYFKWKNDPEKLKSYFSKVLKGNNLKHFLKLFEVDPLDQELRDYDKQEQKFSQLKAKLSKADWQALIQNYSDTFNVYDKDVATWLTTDDNPEDEFSTFATEGPESKVKAIAADLAAKMVWGEDVEEYHSWEVPLSDGSSGSPY